MPTVGSPWNSRRPPVGLRFVSWLAVLLLLPLVGSGQQPPARSRLQLPFDPGADPQLFLKSLLARVKDREAFERLWHDWQRNQDWREKFQGAWNNPQLRERIEKMLHKEGGQLKKLDPQQVEVLRKTWEQLKPPEGLKLSPDGGPKNLPAGRWPGRAQASKRHRLPIWQPRRTKHGSPSGCMIGCRSWKRRTSARCCVSHPPSNRALPIYRKRSCTGAAAGRACTSGTCPSWSRAFHCRIGTCLS